MQSFAQIDQPVVGFQFSVLFVEHEDALQSRDIFYGLCAQSCAVQPVLILI